MKVREIMTRTVDSIDAREPIAAVAARLAEDDIGAFPVLSNGELVGIVTDRNIAVRAVGAGVPLGNPIRTIMTRRVATCSPDDDVGTVLALMARERIRRMPVRDRNFDVIGIVGLSDFAKVEWLGAEVAKTLADICEPSGLQIEVPVLA